MKMKYNKGLFLIILLMSALQQIKAQQVSVAIVESAGGCLLQTNCDTFLICLDVRMTVDVNKSVQSYNIWVEYNGDILSREWLGHNAMGESLGIGDHSCHLTDAIDTDFEGPQFNPDHWRVTGVQGSYPMVANVSEAMHTICFKILQPALLYGQQICVGGNVGGNVSTVTFTDASNDSSIPETCMTLNESFISCSSILPVALLSFNASKSDNTSVLEWKTTNELNSAYFEIQRAGEDKHFTAIGKVSGAGNSTSIQSYRYVDTSPYSGANFYRLRQVDFDGAFSFSPIRSIQFDTRSPGIAIWPNPTHDGINIVTDDANGLGFDVVIMDLEGRVVQKQHAGENQMELWIDLHTLQPAVYHVMVSGQGFVWNEKIIKTE